MPDPTHSPTPAPTPTPPAPAPAPAPAPTPTPEPTPPGTPPDDTLGPAGMAALTAERDARKAAERAQRQAERERDDLRRAQETEQQRLQREAEEGKTLSAAATTKLRQANLLIALTGKGMTGAKAKAAIRLLDGVEYDDSDEPTNLDSRIEAAKAEFGADLFSGATPPPTPTPTPQPTPTPAPPDLHQGPRPPAPPSQDEDAQFAAYMSQHFPQFAPQGAGGGES